MITPRNVGVLETTTLRSTRSSPVFAFIVDRKNCRSEPGTVPKDLEARVNVYYLAEANPPRLKRQLSCLLPTNSNRTSWVLRSIHRTPDSYHVTTFTERLIATPVGMWGNDRCNKSGINRRCLYGSDFTGARPKVEEKFYGDSNQPITSTCWSDKNMPTESKKKKIKEQNLQIWVMKEVTTTEHGKRTRDIMKRKLYGKMGNAVRITA